MSFYDKIRIDEVTGCWNWTGALFKHRGNYGVSQFGGKQYRAHRFSYELHKGEIPKGIQVCHSCDNPGCVNPDHLWLGTAKDNADDRDRKGRGSPPPRLFGDDNPSRSKPWTRPRGENHHKVKAAMARQGGDHL